MTKEERKKKIAIIKALLSKTVENGCTEDEMASALALAKKLMDQNDLDETDLHFGGEGVTVETVVKTDFDKIRGQLVMPVGRFCHCSAWVVGKGSDTISYAGLESETIFAHWMLDMLADFVLFSLDGYAHRNLRSRRVTRLERSAFIVGCATRIAERLQALTPRPVAGTGRDLVIAKNQLIDAELARRGIKLRETFKLYSLDPEAYAAGEEAGDRAQFNRPVDGSTEQRLLG